MCSFKMKFADLHLHSIFSDSTYTPQVLIKEAKKVNLSCIALVDHDIVEGIIPCLEEAKGQGVEVLPGIELTCEHNDIEVHILGYLIDYKNKELLKQLNFLKKNRVERIYKIADKLKTLGINLKAESVFALAQSGTVGRLHVARAMLKEKLIKTTGEAFEKYIGDKGPANVLGFRLSVVEAVELIKRTGGIPVLAHPYSLKNDLLIEQFIDYGLMGLEVYYPEHRPSMVSKYLNLTKKHNLLATGGSDCHGLAKPQVQIGSIKIPYELVEKLKSAKKNLC